MRYLEQNIDFSKYLQRTVKMNISQVVPRRSYDGSLYLKIEGAEKSSWINPRKKTNSHGYHQIEIDFKTLTTKWQCNCCYTPLDPTNMFKEDSVVREYIEYLTKFIENYDMRCLRQQSSVGLYVEMYFDTESRVFAINLSDSSSAITTMSYPFNTEDTDISKNADESYNFYYFKNVLEGDVDLPIDYSSTRRSHNADAIACLYPHIGVAPTNFHTVNSEVTKFLNKDLLDALYPCIKVGPSGLSKRVQEELRQIELANRTKLSKEMQSNLVSLKEQQIAKLMRAYQLIKEATELLDGIKGTLDFEPIKLENIASVVFKNGGTPTANGYVEFEDFFKNNAILRMLDLSMLDLTNVDIRGMDFSGTNIHIDPQIIYNKDMTNVNADGIKFSPFNDSFENVILNGAIITDKEANIDLNTVQSYDSRTVIKKETIIII